MEKTYLNEVYFQVVQNMELINKIISESQPNCDFCNAKIFTVSVDMGYVDTR